MASYRHLARTCVMQTIFEIEFRNGPFSNHNDEGTTPKEAKLRAQKLLSSILNEFAPKLTEKKFATETLDGVLKNQTDILDIIQKYAPEWPLDKIARIDRAILEIGVYEVVFAHDIPPIVAINEAVEIAKHFGDNNSQKFINGVLSSVMKNFNEKL